MFYICVGIPCSMSQCSIAADTLAIIGVNNQNIRIAVYVV